MRVLKFIGIGILGIAAIGLFICGTMHLWNYLVPLLFHGPIISFWQTVGLLVLSKIIFSGIGHGGKKHCGCHCKCNCNGNTIESRHHKHGEWWKKFHEMKHGEKCCSSEKTETVE